MTKIYQITPFLHIPNLQEAMDFFCLVLGFKCKYQEPGYAYLELSGCGLRMLELEPDCALPEPGQLTVYIDVADVDALFAELSTALSQLPPARVQGLADKAWGQREFQVRMPDGHWLTFGAPLRR